MLAYPIATAAFLLLLGPDADAASTPKQMMEFNRAMNSKKTNSARKLSSKDHQDFQATLYGNSKQSSAMRKKLIKKSTVVTSPEERKLQNSNNGNNYNNNNAYKSSTNGKDGSDDYFAATGNWNNAFGFDPSQYSLSYHRCASVRQFDDEIAAQEDTDSVFATKHFAVFRFCPEATCMGIQTEEIECDEATYGEEYCEAMRQYAKNGQNGQSYVQGQSYAQGQDGQEAQEGDGQWGQEEEEVLLGARGEGCQSNYGEYMIELEDYLALMLEYQEERFETYCEYCETCMYNVYQYWLKSGGRRRNLVEFDDWKNNPQEHRDLSGNAAAAYYKVCPEYDTCAEYSKMCSNEMDVAYADYFECTEMERSNGQVAYIAPHCAEDGFTVTLGVYADQNCNEYIGNGVDIANYIGETLDEDALKAWYNGNGALDVLEYSDDRNVCIPCRKADLMYEENSGYVNQDDETDDYTQNMNYQETEINEICENLYLVSARCDKHFRSYTTKSKQAKYAEAVAQEDLSCDFIDSIVMGNYNEMGFINLGDDYTVESAAWLKNNMYAQQYGHYVTEVSPLQIFGLVASLAVCGILAIWSMTLHKSLSKRGPWKPTRGLNNMAKPTNAADLNRQNSGIVLGRSQTDASYYMS